MCDTVSLVSPRSTETAMSETNVLLDISIVSLV